MSHPPWILNNWRFDWLCVVWDRLSSIPPLYLCDTFCISVFTVILIYQQVPTWITWGLKNGEWGFLQAKEQTRYEKRLPWMSQVQSTLSLQLTCIRSWTSIAALWQSVERLGLLCRCPGTWGKCSWTLTKNQEILDKIRNPSIYATVRRKGNT